jgi:hypothetical protein
LNRRDSADESASDTAADSHRRSFDRYPPIRQRSDERSYSVAWRVCSSQ